MEENLNTENELIEGGNVDEIEGKNKIKGQKELRNGDEFKSSSLGVRNRWIIGLIFLSLISILFVILINISSRDNIVRDSQTSNNNTDKPNVEGDNNKLSEDPEPISEIDWEILEYTYPYSNLSLSIQYPSDWKTLIDGEACGPQIFAENTKEEALISSPFSYSNPVQLSICRQSVIKGRDIDDELSYLSRLEDNPTRVSLNKFEGISYLDEGMLYNEYLSNSMYYEYLDNGKIHYYRYYILVRVSDVDQEERLRNLQIIERIIGSFETPDSTVEDLNSDISNRYGIHTNKLINYTGKIINFKESQVDVKLKIAGNYPNYYEVEIVDFMEGFSDTSNLIGGKMRFIDGRYEYKSADGNWSEDLGIFDQSDIKREVFNIEEIDKGLKNIFVPIPFSINKYRQLEEEWFYDILNRSEMNGYVFMTFHRLHNTDLFKLKKQISDSNGDRFSRDYEYRWDSKSSQIHYWDSGVGSDYWQFSLSPIENNSIEISQ